jgi:uncharacterized protein YceK
MKKVLIGLALVVALSGCETMYEVRGASSQGMAGLSCSQIYSTYDAYKRDRQNLDLIRTLVALQGVDASQVTKQNASSYYNTVIASSNIALAVQGCAPLR